MYCVYCMCYVQETRTSRCPRGLSATVTEGYTRGKGEAGSDRRRRGWSSLAKLQHIYGNDSNSSSSSRKMRRKSPRSHEPDERVSRLTRWTPTTPAIQQFVRNRRWTRTWRYVLLHAEQCPTFVRDHHLLPLVIHVLRGLTTTFKLPFDFLNCFIFFRGRTR